MDWPPYLNVSDFDAFFAAMRAAVNASSDWTLPKNHALGADRCFTADYVGGAFCGDRLALALCSFDDQPRRIQVTMHAERWANDLSFPSEEEYSLAESLAAPLFEAAGKALHRKIKLLRPKNEPRPLRGALAIAFERFSLSATDVWTSRKVHALHPLDGMRFWGFIRLAHQYSSVLRPEDVRLYLTRAGFDADVAEKLTNEYVIGRRILAMHLYPWQIREERKRARERRRKEDHEEYERVFGRPKPREGTRT